MARKLKTYETSLGFFDLAIAAPSMKAALDAWGADSNLFHQGAARQSEDPDVVAATMKMPGVVLKRPVGSNGPFTQNANLPTAIEDGRSKKSTRKSTTSKAPKRFKPAGDKAAERAAAVAYESKSSAIANMHGKKAYVKRSASAGRQPSKKRKTPSMPPVKDTPRQ